jgi:hypothetical protein
MFTSGSSDFIDEVLGDNTRLVAIAIVVLTAHAAVLIWNERFPLQCSSSCSGCNKQSQPVLWSSRRLKRSGVGMLATSKTPISTCGR